MLKQPFIFDISRYQIIPPNLGQPWHTIDWDKAWAMGIRVAGIRATVGNYYSDPTFEINYDTAKQKGFIPVPYHVVKPSHSYSSQINKFLTTLGSRKSDIPLAMDCELSDLLTAKQVTSCLQSCFKETAYRDGRNPFNYTRQTWWDTYVLHWSEWKTYPLWVAWYPFDINYPNVPIERIPEDWREVGETFWQKSAGGNKQGKIYGAESADIDLDWYKGTAEQFDIQFSTHISGSPPQPIYTHEEIHEILWREAQFHGWNLIK
jgi:GH25 family lysozyme M1 (1,4-beta-N-acetylmuramidase)